MKVEQQVNMYEERPQTSPVLKRVRFAETCRARVFAPPADADDLWYGIEDYEKFRIDCKETVRSFKTMTPMEQRKVESMNTSSTSRGLEYMIYPEKGARRKGRRALAFDIIWKEQAYQYEVGIFCDESLALAYEAVSLSSQLDAHERALEYSEGECCGRACYFDGGKAFARCELMEHYLPTLDILIHRWEGARIQVDEPEPRAVVARPA